MEEIEVKFLNINPSQMEEKLEKIGARKVGEFFQRWTIFEYPDWRLHKDASWLRLRDEGNGKITLSYKKRIGIKGHDGTQNDDGMEEVEIEVDDFDRTALIFEKLGFIVKHSAEKKRTRWGKDGVEYDIDSYPELAPFLEIETYSWEKIDEAIAQLGLDHNDKKIFSAYQVYTLQGIDVSKLEKISFAEGLVERKVNQLP